MIIKLERQVDWWSGRPSPMYQGVGVGHKDILLCRKGLLRKIHPDKNPRAKLVVEVLKPKDPKSKHKDCFTFSSHGKIKGVRSPLPHYTQKTLCVLYRKGYRKFRLYWED